MIHFLKLLFLTVIFASCRSQSDAPNVPPRKEGIPTDAFWVGGVDGGNWYQVVSVHNHKNNAFIKVFNDATGDLIVERRFFVVCIGATNPIWIEDLKNQITGFDGEKIYLQHPQGRDSCWLQ
jgi:hypothetical protein